MDVLVLIDKLDDTVHNAKSVPLTDQVRVDKEEVYDILDQMRATIPEEIKQARWIVKERQEMLAEAKREAERIVKRGARGQVRLVAEEEIIKQAERAAEDIIEDARAREREIRLGAEDYADDILNTLEVNLTKFIAAVQRGRDRLQGREEGRGLVGRKQPAGRLRTDGLAEAAGLAGCAPMVWEARLGRSAPARPSAGVTARVTGDWLSSAAGKGRLDGPPAPPRPLIPPSVARTPMLPAVGTRGSRLVSRALKVFCSQFGSFCSGSRGETYEVAVSLVQSVGPAGWVRPDPSLPPTQPAKGESMHLSEPSAAGTRRGLLWLSALAIALWLSLVRAR